LLLAALCHGVAAPIAHKSARGAVGGKVLAAVAIDTFEPHNVATSFTFLGYDFKVRTPRSSKGELFRKCMPGASMKAMRRMVDTIKHWRIH
jgi:hypothetical protein